MLTVIAIAVWVGMAKPAAAATFEETVRGRFLLDVNERGELWYVDPATNERSYLNAHNPTDIAGVVQRTGLVVLSAQFSNRTFLNSQRGRLLIDEKAVVWYVDPGDGLLYRLGNPLSDVFGTMVARSLGITNENLRLVKQSIYSVTPPPPITASATVTISARDFYFLPERAAVGQNSITTIVFKNNGTMPHNLQIAGLGVNTPTIAAGQETRVVLTNPPMGIYAVICSVPGHEQAGMHGTLAVVIDP